MYTIRKAEPSDYKAIARYLLMAMEDIVYKFIGQEDKDKALDFLEHFTPEKGNQYSYENCHVILHNGEVIGAANVYDGDNLAALRTPVKKYVEETHAKDFSPEDETEAGEYYLDTLGIDPAYRGKGLGTQLLNFLITEYTVKRHKPLGLLVDNDNPKAKKLYEILGFKKVADKTLVGKKMEHLQYAPSQE
ncbi:GNAT family N-acetyltransferase [Ornithobacterium rhinotracheale]|uniref:GNAT family N-acetyltransferase n=1 Tax=Ornithobacterium rhinotracheale TaxID=28251 RepID=UPI00129C72EA|nr:GNAT family N-acetyltransferase [Ornithobacterium rhinotracheale]MRJ08467.1 GNAT family N-acetyltransferase [Ornithobacterium rhinotracheale]MRJ10177.1 GNAT family N-acetyltransferase [Ornithobacterium rhinotracheale]UOH76742.1 GNAT family N-acetyltransferase [Ornithobacterium rhinotracheale]